jgi:hypothetical protein
MKLGQWMYNFGDEEHWNECKYFDTREEAIEAGKQEAIVREKESYQVGQIQNFIPKICADSILEQISEDAYEECGDNVGDYPYTNNEDEKKLQDMLEEVLERWMDKTGNYPTFYKIRCVENITVNREEN